MDGHLDTPITDYPRIMPCIGQIKAVRHKDHTNNPHGKYTVYDLTLHMQFPGTNHEFENVPPGGQFAGGAIEIQFDYIVDQYVMVGFREGNANLPFIMFPFPSLDTAVAGTDAQGPRVRILANGAEVLIDKDGNVSIVPKSGEELTLGGLVGASGLKTLIHSDFFTQLAGAFTAVTILPGDGGAAIKTAIAAYLNLAGTKTANSTSVTKAK